MTCCQVSKHGVAGDETTASRKQIGDLMYALISFHLLHTLVLLIETMCVCVVNSGVHLL